MKKRGQAGSWNCQAWAKETPAIKSLPKKMKKSVHGSGAFTQTEINQGYRRIVGGD